MAVTGACAALGTIGGPAVYEDAVILNKAHTGFITAMIENGTVASLSANTLAIREGIGTGIYKTVSIAIPAGATVVRTFKTANLNALRAGDHVHVTQSSDGTTVFANDGTARPPGGGVRRPLARPRARPLDHLI